MEGGQGTSCVVNGTGNCCAKYGPVKDAIIIRNGGGHEEDTGLTSVCVCVNIPD